MSANKLKDPVKKTHYSYIHMRKYKDAVMYGADRAKQTLPDQFHTEMHSFMFSMQKEKTQAKKEGKLDEEEADPIPFPLYRLICQYAILTGNMFLWSFTACQWNLMARSVNIDDLTFGQFKIGKDSIVIEYDDTKKDPTGEKTTPKNCYPNPFDVRICMFTALGCYLSSCQESFSNPDKKTIFRKANTKKGSGSHLYCETLRKLFEGAMHDILSNYIHPDHANAHGFCKGQLVYV